MRDSNCKECGVGFRTAHPRKIFCDDVCKYRWHDARRPDRKAGRRVAYREGRTPQRPNRIGDRLVVDCLECAAKFTHTIGSGRGRHPRLCSEVCRRRRRRRAELQDKYDISLERYEFMYEQQAGRCPICSNLLLNPLNRRQDRFAAVDHDHATGEVRGLLCYPCNLALGQFGDDPARLISALAYLGIQVGLLPVEVIR